ncbi:MAG TPA: hypothetical protein DIV39_03060, partial [Verrucomicrobiales bacterium]|nr:hypothetical protein [Verrucomicrobiales bacterium]
LLQEGGSHVVSLPVNEPEDNQQIAIRSSLNLNGNEDRDPGNNVLAGNIGLVEEPVQAPDQSPEAD